ncbi:uncharacterized protein LOC144658847 [Oculina patagonica]
MWWDIMKDPCASSYPRAQATGNPFYGFGGFYGERPRSFWEDPVYFPSGKPRRVSNRKKAKREEHRQSDDNKSSTTRPLDRENPSTKRDDKKVKGDEQKQTCPSRPKLSQAAMDIPIPIEILPREENVLSESFEKTSNDAPYDGSRSNKPRAQPSVESTSTRTDEGASQMNQTAADVEAAGENAPIVDEKPEKQTTEEQKLNAIESELSKAKELIPRVLAFEGSRKDKEYLYLEEHLTRCILSLDRIETDGQENVKSARRATVKEILSIANDLEARVQE